MPKRNNYLVIISFLNTEEWPVMIFKRNTP